MKSNAEADARFGQAMARATVGKAQPSRPTLVKAPPVRQLDENEIELGAPETGSDAIAIDLLKLMDGRMLIQGVSGAGKSWTLRRLLEQSAGRIQQLIIDPEGEFRSLAEKLGYLYVEGARYRGTALAELGRRAREHRLSFVLDLSDLPREGQMQAVSGLLFSLIECPREWWNPAIVAIDEAHLFAPFGGQSAASSAVRKAAIGAVVDLMSRGRKRGLAGILATQRLARLSKSVASEVQNFLIGMNTLDLDVKRAAETIGWDARRAFDRLPLLQPGSFVTAGPAFSLSPSIVRVGPVASRHIGATPALSRVRDIDPSKAGELLDLEGLAQFGEEEEVAGATPGRREVMAFIRDPSFALAGQVIEALKPMVPDGADLDDLAKHLKTDRTRLAGALALLFEYRAIELRGNSARIRRGLFDQPARKS